MTAFRRFDPWTAIVGKAGKTAEAGSRDGAVPAASDLRDGDTDKRAGQTPGFSNFSGLSGPAPAGVEKPSPEAAKPATPDHAEDHRARYEGRAAIAAHHGGRDRATAERLAFEDGVAEWLNRNPPVQADPYCCLQSGQPEGMGAALLPVLTGDGGHVWVHDLCYAGWWNRRRAEAIAALGMLRLMPPR